MKIILFLLLWVVLGLKAYGQPVYHFKVKVGIDKETVEALGGETTVRKKCADLFDRVNNAFNNGQLIGIYHFEVDWDAFYVYDGPSFDELFKPHPNHDYKVIMDGFKNYPSEVGGGWFGREMQVIYHSRLHLIHSVSDPFDDPKATDALVHEFGHARGVPDIYAMLVDADKNPVNGFSFPGVRCIMNQCYGETRWSDYAVNIINLTADKVVESDDIVNRLFPEKVLIKLVGRDSRPVPNAEINLYPVKWYTREVISEIEWRGITDAKGEFSLPGNPFGYDWTYARLKYCNFLIEVKKEGKVSYGWLPLYLIQNAVFEGSGVFTLELLLKEGFTRYIEDMTRNLK